MQLQDLDRLSHPGSVLYLAAIAFTLVVLSSLHTVKPIICRSPFAFKWVPALLHRSKSSKQELSELKLHDHEPTIYTKQWWTDEKQYQLERRAIFSQTWLYVTHASRFHKAGDYRTFQIAGFSIIVILGKDNQLRAFHNVCRHRAYAITKKKCGSSLVLGCRYHGWSYDTRGNLLKAPEFDKVPEFDKRANGLWPIHTETRKGFVFVNFDAGKNLALLDVGSLKYLTLHLMPIADWKVEGQMNWKLAVELLSHGLPDIESNTVYELMYRTVFFQKRKVKRLGSIGFVFHLPSRLTLTMRVLPLSSRKTSFECNLYGTLSSRQDELERTRKVERNIAQQVRQMEITQNLYLKQTYSSTCQDEFKRLLDQHRSSEKVLGQQILPATQKLSFTNQGKADDELCRELEKESNGMSACESNLAGILDW